jgi:hypothetical protein
VLLEDERGDVLHRRLPIVFEDDAVDDGEADVRIVARDDLHDRTLREADADDEVIAALRERAHRRLDRRRVPGLDVAEHDPEGRPSAGRPAVRQHSCFGALDPCPGRGIERPIVLAADVEDDADANLRGVLRGARPAAGRQGQERHGHAEEREDARQDHHRALPNEPCRE